MRAATRPPAAGRLSSVTAHIQYMSTDTIAPAARTTTVPWLAAARTIFAEHQFDMVDGSLLDAYTASPLVQVHDSLSEVNAARFAGMPLLKAVDIAWKLASK
jgi:hypothetical protein